MIRFSLNELLCPQKCYELLLHVLHPNGLVCPQGHALPADQAPHDWHRAPVMDYRCRECGAVFNIFTDTLWEKTRLACETIVLILQGITQGKPTLQIADELELDYSWLLKRRHQIQAQAQEALPRDTALSDPVTEADEMYQNAGEKGEKHSDPADPPRRRANKARGHGTWDNDRPPVLGIVGRTTGHIRLTVCHNSQRETLQPKTEAATRSDATVYTDEWSAYDRLPETGRQHASVCHTPGKREWARDDDGDGIREVHCNTMEGIWTGLRNFLRSFRGVHKKYLAQYVAIFEWAHNLKEATLDYLRRLMGCFTPEPT
jgi:transposase-like protein